MFVFALRYLVPMKIMIVDDNKKIREVIKKIILADEYIEYADAESAIIAYKSEKPDWILLDIKLPGIEGIEAARIIRSSYSEAQIVMVTDYSDEKHRKAAAEAGVDEFVSKENLIELRRIISHGKG